MSNKEPSLICFIKIAIRTRSSKNNFGSYKQTQNIFCFRSESGDDSRSESTTLIARVGRKGGGGGAPKILSGIQGFVGAFPFPLHFIACIFLCRRKSWRSRSRILILIPNPEPRWAAGRWHTWAVDWRRARRWRRSRNSAAPLPSSTAAATATPARCWELRGRSALSDLPRAES